jgi:hypothetical protein
MPSDSKLIFDSYCILTGACTFYQQSRICDKTIFRILSSHFTQFKNEFNFTCKTLNRALSAKAGLCTHQTPYGIYMANFSTVCPYSGDKRKVFYYFIQDTNDNQPPDDPVSASDAVDKYASSNQLQRNCMGGEKGGEGGEEVKKGEGAWI